MQEATLRDRIGHALRSVWTELRWMRVRLDLLLWRRRYSAFPFHNLSRSCPVCGGVYEGHEAASLGGDVAPGARFSSAVSNGDWASLSPEGGSRLPLGNADLVVGLALRCPARDRYVVFLLDDPGPPDRFGPVRSQQILGDRSAAELARLPLEWRPVIRDRLRDMQAAERRDRLERRRLRQIDRMLERECRSADEPTREALLRAGPDLPRRLVALLYRGRRGSSQRSARALEALGWGVRSEKRWLGRRYLVRDPAAPEWTLVDPGTELRPATLAEIERMAGSEPSRRRRELFVDAREGYPAAPSIEYECARCGRTVPSMPDEPAVCGCGDIAVDTDCGRVSVKDHGSFRVFVLTE